MTEALKLPVGIEDFAEIRQAGFYYVDKTKFIEQLLDFRLMLQKHYRKYY